MKLKIIFLMIILISCSSRHQHRQDTEIKDTFAYADSRQSDTNKSQLIGIYEYIYPDNTKDLIENHYMKIEKSKNKIFGTYYGTSDDFDEARSEYLPGFFKASMIDLIMTDSTISFNLRVDSKDMFEKAITPFDNPEHNDSWGISVRYKERKYRGTIHYDTIFIKTKNFDIRPFIKK